MKKGRKVPFFISEIFHIYFELIIFLREIFFDLVRSPGYSKCND
jgi:hypothetical protein